MKRTRIAGYAYVGFGALVVGAILASFVVAHPHLAPALKVALPAGGAILYIIVFGVVPTLLARRLAARPLKETV
jgi:zinc transporter ZupT